MVVFLRVSCFAFFDVRVRLALVALNKTAHFVRPRICNEMSQNKNTNFLFPEQKEGDLINSKVLNLKDS